MDRLGRLSLFAATADERVTPPLITALAAADGASPTALVGLASGAVAHVEVRKRHLAPMLFKQRPERDEARRLSGCALLGLYQVPPPAGGPPAGDGGGTAGDAVTALVGLGGGGFASGHRSGAVRLWSAAYAAAAPPPAGGPDRGVWRRVSPLVTADAAAGRAYRSSPLRTAAVLPSAVTVLAAAAVGGGAVLLAAGTEDGVLAVLRPACAAAPPLRLHGTDCGAVHAVAFCVNDGDGDAAAAAAAATAAPAAPTPPAVTVATAGEDDAVHVHRFPTGRFFPAAAAAAAAAGATAPATPAARRRARPTRVSLRGHDAFVTGLAWHAPSAALLSASLDGVLLAWHRAPGVDGAPAEWAPVPTVLPLPPIGRLLSVAVVSRPGGGAAADADGGGGSGGGGGGGGGSPPLRGRPPPPPPPPAELYVSALSDEVGLVTLHRFAVEAAARGTPPPATAADVVMVPAEDVEPPE